MTNNKSKKHGVEQSLDTNWKEIFEGVERNNESRLNCLVQEKRPDITKGLLELMGSFADDSTGKSDRVMAAFQETQILKGFLGKMGLFKRKSKREQNIAALDKMTNQQLMGYAAYSIKMIGFVFDAMPGIENQAKNARAIFEARIKLKKVIEEIGNANREDKARLGALKLRFENGESERNKIAKLGEELASLKKSDHHEESVMVIGLQVRLEKLQSKREFAARKLLEMQKDVDKVILPLKGIAQKYDYEMSNYQGRLSDFVANISTILEDQERFMSKIETLHSLLEKNKIEVKDARERTKILEACERILLQKNRVEIIPKIKAAVGLTKYLLEMDKRIERCNKEAFAASFGIRNRDKNIQEIEGKIDRLSAGIDETNSEIVRIAGLYNLKVAINGRDISVLKNEVRAG